MLSLSKNKRIILLGLSVLFSSFFSLAQTKKTRILFLVDASSSMSYNWNTSMTRFEVASNILLQLIDSIYTVNNEVEFAVRAYGTLYPAQEKNCADTKLEVPFNIQNAYQIKTRLKNIRPIGYSPISYSLIQASENELNNDLNYDYSIILINDGGESCQGDVCATFNKFLQRKIKVTPYIIGLERNEQTQKYYDCIGNFLEVTTPEAIRGAIKTIVDAHRQVLDKPKSLNLTTQFSNVKEIKDSIKTVKNEAAQAPLKKEELRHLQVYRADYIFKFDIPELNSLKLSKNIQFKLTLPEEATPISKPEQKPISKSTETIIALKRKSSFKKVPNIIIPNANFIIPDKNISFSLNLDAETPKPAPRVTDVFPRLYPVKTPYRKYKSENPTAVPLKKIERIEFALRVEKPRDTSSLTKLRLTRAPFLKSNKPKPNLDKISINKTVSFALKVDQEESLKLNWLKRVKFPYSYSYATGVPNRLINYPNKIAFKLNLDKPKDTVKKVVVQNTPIIDNTNLEFTVETQNSAETMVQVYFKGPNGKVYPKYSPEILVVDPVSKAQIASFKRVVENGEPVPQKVASGKYNIVVSGSNDLFAKDVTITQNKLNKVYIKVSDGTLAFSYKTDPSRPVLEFNAEINRRFADAPNVNMNCSEKKFFEPGTYYIEISTFPITKRSVYVEFGALNVQAIDQPGTLIIANTEARGKAQLQQVLGDQFITFATLNLKGNDPAISIQPGTYQILYPANPKLPDAGFKRLKFQIKEKRETSITLE